MSTMCFDIKRVDDNYVCIQHCNSNVFEYEYHLPLSFYPRQRRGKNNWWLEDKKYRYVWVVVEKQDTGIEKPIWTCNDKIWLNSTVKLYFRDKNIRIIKLPFESITDGVELSDGTKIPSYKTTDLKDKFKLYCPVDLNEKYHVYTDHYEEIEPKIEEEIELDGQKTIFKRRQFKWVAPKMLGE